MTPIRCCMVALVTVTLLFQFACNSQDRKLIGNVNEEGDWTDGSGLTSGQMPVLSSSDPAGDGTCFVYEEDILGVEARQDDAEVVVTITFDGDHRARFEADNGNTIVVQFDNKQDFIDSWIKAFEDKVVEHKAKMSYQWNGDGSQMIIGFEGDFTTQDINYVRVESLGCDEAIAEAG